MSEYNQLGIALRRHSRISTISKSCDKQVLYLSFMCDISLLCKVVLYDDVVFCKVKEKERQYDEYLGKIRNIKYF